MDKFGVFNLINSLFELYKNSQTQPKEDANPLFSALKNFSPPSAPKNEPEPLPSKPPLQAQMLSTAKSHDEHVKRVLAKSRD